MDCVSFKSNLDFYLEKSSSPSIPLQEDWNSFCSAMRQHILDCADCYDLYVAALRGLQKKTGENVHGKKSNIDSIKYAHTLFIRKVQYGISKGIEKDKLSSLINKTFQKEYESFQKYQSKRKDSFDENLNKMVG